MVRERDYKRWLNCKNFFLAKYFRYYQNVVFLFFIFFSNFLWAKSPIHLFMGISGGYGEASDAYASTGSNGLIRFAFGSLWPINSSFVVGDQLGFQTGSQIRLTNQVTEILGTGNVPPVLNTKNPIDFLLIGRYILHEPLFFQVKGGYAFISSTVSGADITVSNSFIPEIQIGLGFNTYKRSRVTFSYQKLYGKSLSLSVIDLTKGTYQLDGTPSWQGVLLTFEHDL